jgi:hypothetical protein
MMASRGMGDISPSKMPKGKKTARRDNTDFTQYAEGGMTASKKKLGKTSKGAKFAQMLKKLK